jgi:hypothetical protein
MNLPSTRRPTRDGDLQLKNEATGSPGSRCDRLDKRIKFLTGSANADGNAGVAGVSAPRQHGDVDVLVFGQQDGG